MQYRIATIDDIETLVGLRRTQLIDEGLTPNTDITEQLTQFFTQNLDNNQLVQWLALDKNTAIASGAILFHAFPPSYYNPSGIRGYIANMYTAPSHRGQGIARKILDLLVEEARMRHVTKLFLYGSEMGKSVYEKYGFQFVDAYMELDLNKHE